MAGFVWLVFAFTHLAGYNILGLVFPENSVQVVPFSGIYYALLGANLFFFSLSLLIIQWGFLISIFRSFQLQKIVSNYTLDDCFF